MDGGRAERPCEARGFHRADGRERVRYQLLQDGQVRPRRKVRNEASGSRILPSSGGGRRQSAE